MLLFLEEKSRPLACASAQGRRRAVRAKSRANLHKVGCSWSAGAIDHPVEGSAGPTTPLRFEPSTGWSIAPQTGEPTVSHVGGNGIDFSSAFSNPNLQLRVSEEESRPLACAPAQGRRRAVRAQSSANLHKVGCSWSASADDHPVDGSAGPTTPLRFEPSTVWSSALQTGAPTVSHVGGNGIDSSSNSSGPSRSGPHCDFAFAKSSGARWPT